MMALKQDVHPSVDQLSNFAVGRLSIESVAEIEKHVAGCDTCLETVRQVDDDTFVDFVRESRSCLAMDVGPTHADEQNPVSQAATAEHWSDSVLQSPLQGTAQSWPDTILQDHPRYHVQNLIGVGGMGAVYQAQHRLMERPVAVKVINKQLVASSSAVQRFHREVRAAARLDHPNIVRAFDAEQDGDVHFLVMEHVQGIDLHELVEQRGPLPIAEACEYVRQAAMGLQHAHENGMVHRDVKPQNLMLTNEGRVKILDFGLASLTTETATEDTSEADQQSGTRPPSLTEAGTIMGTPDYVAPEQIDDAGSVDVRADVYSLGCTLYYLLTGKAPFPGGSAKEKIFAHLNHEPTPIGELRPDLPAKLCRVVAKMMAKDREERYQAPHDVAAALESVNEAESKPSKWSNGDRFAIATGVLTVGCALLAMTGLSLPHLALIWFVGACIGWGLSTWATAKQPPGRVTLTGWLSWVGTVALAGIVIYLQTRDGTVRIEINDPRIKVRFAGKTITVDNDGKPIRIKPGEHWLVVERGDLKFETTSFQIRRNEKIALKVELLAGKVVVSKDGRQIGAKDLLAKHLIAEEWKRLEGRWQGVAGQRDGIPEPEKAKEGGIQVKGRQLTFFENGRTAAAMAASIDPTASPKQIDLTGMRKGIYKLERDQWTLCLAGVGQPRPKVFETKPGSGGGTHLMVLRRQASGPKPMNEFTKVGRFTGHEGHVYHAIVSPDGKYPISGGEDKTIRIWDREVSLTGHKGSVFGLAVSADGKLLASSDRTGSIRLWDFVSFGQLAELPGHEGPVSEVAFMPDGKHLLSAGFDETLRLWNVKDRKLVRTIEIGAKVEKMAPLWDGKRVMLSGAHTGGWGVVTYDLDKGGRIDTKASALSCLAVSADGRKTLIGTITGLLRVHNKETGKLIVQMADPRAKAARDAAILPGERYAITTTREGSMHLWDLKEGTRLATVSDETIGTISLSRDGRFALTLGRGEGVGVWKLPDFVKRTKGLGNVSGKVTIDGKPLANATVEFHPVGGGRTSTGRTDDTGGYELEYADEQHGALVGKHVVKISRVITGTSEDGKPMRREVVPSRYNERSELTVEVKPGTNERNFDVRSRPSKR